MKKPLSETASMRMDIVDVRVIHVHPLQDHAVVVFTLRYEGKLQEFPGSLTLPLSRVQELRLEVGDELEILTKKSKSTYHERARKT